MIGGDGSGKRTLAKLLVGLYEPETGEVCAGARGSEPFAAVFSDFFLFRSLLDVGEAAQARARELLQRFGLAQRVRIEAGRFSTTELSRGQQTRLALTAALL